MAHDEKMIPGQRIPMPVGSGFGSPSQAGPAHTPDDGLMPSRTQRTSPPAVALETLSGGRTLSGTGCGKAILLGEHSVVFGKSAIATALPDLKLSLTLHDPELRRSLSAPADWREAWSVFTPGGQSELHGAQRELLTRCLAQAIEDAGCSMPLAAFAPELVSVRMNFPLGAGLGGSAALCAAAVDLVDQIATFHPVFRVQGGFQRRVGCAPRVAVDASSLASASRAAQTKAEARIRHDGFSEDLVQRVSRATRLDHFFHGTASGVDTATVVSRGLLECQGGAAFRPLANGQQFYLALVDSGTRSETARMVAHVRERRVQQPVYVDEKINRLGELAHLARFDLQDGRLAAIGEAMNEAHEHLADLGLSTPELDQIVFSLRELGALGAKLTGSGGGGFAIGLFREYPEWVVTHLSRKGPIYVSKVPVSILPNSLHLM